MCKFILAMCAGCYWVQSRQHTTNTTMSEEIPTEKQCTKCLAFKPMAAFSNNKSKKDGKQTVCKKCFAAFQAAYYAANKDKKAAYDVAYRAEKRAYRNQCAVINALDPEKMKSLQSKLEAMGKTNNTNQA